MMMDKKVRPGAGAFSKKYTIGGSLSHYCIRGVYGGGECLSCSTGWVGYVGSVVDDGGVGDVRLRRSRFVFCGFNYFLRKWNRGVYVCVWGVRRGEGELYVSRWERFFAFTFY